MITEYQNIFFLKLSKCQQIILWTLKAIPAPEQLWREKKFCRNSEIPKNYIFAFVPSLTCCLQLPTLGSPRMATNRSPRMATNRSPSNGLLIRTIIFHIKKRKLKIICQLRDGISMNTAFHKTRLLSQKITAE